VIFRSKFWGDFKIVSESQNRTVVGRLNRKILRRLVRCLIVIVFLWAGFAVTGRILSNIAIIQIEEFTNTKIETDFINFKFGGSVFIEGLVVRAESGQPGESPVLEASEVYADFDIGSLLLFKPRLRVIRVNDFVFNAQFDLESGNWNIGSLKIRPPSGSSGKMPRVELESGTVQYSKVSDGQIRIVAALPIEAKFEFDKKTEKGYGFELMTAKRISFGKSELTGYWQPGEITVAGGISSSDLPGFERSWVIEVLAAELKYDKENNYRLKLRITDMFGKHSFDEETFAFVGSSFVRGVGVLGGLQRFFGKYQPKGRIGIDLEASGNLENVKASKLRGRVYCKDVWICNRKFPYPVEHIQGEVDFSENSFSFEKLRGRHKSVELEFNGSSEGFGRERRYETRIISENMELGDDLYAALKEGHKKVWSLFSPNGLAKIDYRLSGSPEKGQEKILAVELLGGQAVYRNFPYPLKNLRGKLFFKGDEVTIPELVSVVGQQRVAIGGKVSGTGSEALYDISIEAEKVSLDSTLAAALIEKQWSMYRRFCSSESGGGTSVTFKGRIWKDKKYSKGEHKFSVLAEQLEIDDLLSLLPSRVETAVRKLRPKGRINLETSISSTDDKPFYTRQTDIECLSNSMEFEKFAYPLGGIRGNVKIGWDGQSAKVELVDIVGTTDDIAIRPNDSKIRVDGSLRIADGALEGGQLSVRAEDFFFNEKLDGAIAEKAGSFYNRLSPEGRFNLCFENIKIGSDKDKKKLVDFEGSVELKDCSFNTVPAISSLDAKISVKGLYRVGEGFGNVKIAINDGGFRLLEKKLTNVRAEVSYDPVAKSLESENFVADCYDGAVVGRFSLAKNGEGEYEYLVENNFENIDLKKFLSDTTKVKADGDREYTSGNMYGVLSVSGPVNRTSERLGSCRVKITDMEVGKLSPLAKLLMVLQLNEPTDYAFEQMTVDSYIQRDKLFFEKIDLWGRSVAFNGSGQMNLDDREIDVCLTARGSRLANDEPSVLGSLADALGGAVVRMDVSGSLYDPQVSTETLPVLKRALGILGTKPYRSEKE